MKIEFTSIYLSSGKRFNRPYMFFKADLAIFLIDVSKICIQHPFMCSSLHSIMISFAKK